MATRIMNKLNYEVVTYQNDALDVQSNCLAMSFDNYGLVDCILYCNDYEHLHLPGQGLVMLAGTSFSLGNKNKNSIIQNVFDLVFTGDTIGRRVQIIREGFSIFT
ncbi:MAG: hypothetical protein NTY96_00270 [Bacteroidetes bacterium]|nr:hypothetical protein [Bacteroidota bacterium]